MGFISKGK